MRLSERVVGGVEYADQKKFKTGSWPLQHTPHGERRASNWLRGERDGAKFWRSGRSWIRSKQIMPSLPASEIKFTMLSLWQTIPISRGKVEVWYPSLYTYTDWRGWTIKLILSKQRESSANFSCFWDHTQTALSEKFEIFVGSFDHCLEPAAICSRWTFHWDNISIDFPDRN